MVANNGQGAHKEAVGSRKLFGALRNAQALGARDKHDVADVCQVCYCFLTNNVSHFSHLPLHPMRRLVTRQMQQMGGMGRMGGSRGGRGGAQGFFGMANAKTSTLEKNAKDKIMFKDVAGCDEAKQEVRRGAAGSLGKGWARVEEVQARLCSRMWRAATRRSRK